MKIFNNTMAVCKKKNKVKRRVIDNPYIFYCYFDPSNGFIENISGWQNNLSPPDSTLTYYQQPPAFLNTFKIGLNQASNLIVNIYLPTQCFPLSEFLIYTSFQIQQYDPSNNSQITITNNSVSSPCTPYNNPDCESQFISNFNFNFDYTIGRTYGDIYTNYVDNCTFNYNIFTVDEPTDLINNTRENIIAPCVFTDPSNSIFQSTILGNQFSSGYTINVDGNQDCYQGPTFYFTGTNIIDCDSIPIPNYKIEVTGYPTGCNQSNLPWPAFLINNLSNYPAEYTTNFNSQTNYIFTQQTHIWYLGKDTFVFGGVINYIPHNVPWKIENWNTGTLGCSLPNNIYEYNTNNYWTPTIKDDKTIDTDIPWTYNIADIKK